MQISTKFTIAIHILAATEYFGKTQKVTSGLFADSIGANPVIIRNIMSDLKKAGIIDTKRGPGGITIARPLNQITFCDVYEAVEKNNEHLFNFHNNPNPACPVGRNIHGALDDKLASAQNMFENDLKKFTVDQVTDSIHERIAEGK